MCGQLLLAQAHRGAQRGGAQRALVAQGDELAHHLVEVGHLLERGGRGAVRGMLVGPRRDALELPCVDGKSHATQGTRAPPRNPRLRVHARRHHPRRRGRRRRAPRPRARRRRGPRPRARRRAQRRRHPPARGPLSGAARLAARHPGPRARRRGRRRAGPGAERFAEGDRVMAIVGGGGQAELAAVHERQLMPVPDGLDWPQAGGVPEVFTTAHDALFTQAGLRAGERLLVHGAAGGVGTAGVQLGAAAGAHVTATVRNDEPARRRRRARRPRGPRPRGLRGARPVRRRARARRRAQPRRRPRRRSPPAGGSSSSASAAAPRPSSTSAR